VPVLTAKRVELASLCEPGNGGFWWGLGVGVSTDMPGRRQPNVIPLYVSIYTF
jgi:hypothetical protein